MYSTQSKRTISQAPARIISARNTSAPRMPTMSTRFWNSAGTAKYVNTMRNTKMLSTARAFSTR